VKFLRATRQARVVTLRLGDYGAVVKRAHGAELDDAERLLVEAVAALHEEHRTRAVDPDEDGEEDEERRRQMVASGQSCTNGFVMAGDPRDMPYMHSMIEASRSGDYEPPIGHALEKYKEDSDPENPNEQPV